MSKQTALAPKSKKWLEGRGFTVEKVEWWNSWAHKRQDLLGVGDFLALNGKELLLVQVTDHTHSDSHKKKALASVKLSLWISAGGHFVLHLWKKKNNRWHVSEHSYREIYLGTRKKYQLP